MNPITRAMRRFAAEVEASWRAHPRRVVSLIAAEEHRAHVAQALRLRENAQDNRRLFIVLEQPFTAADTYFTMVADELAEEYELFRVGLAEEGVQIPPFAGQNGATPIGAVERATYAMERAARLLGDRFDGIVVALVPKHVTDTMAWSESIRVLAAMRWSPRVQVAALAPPDGAPPNIAADDGVRFQLDQGELIAFLMQLPEPVVMEAPSAPAGAQDGPLLRDVLLRAADALSAGRAQEAAELYWRARAHCHAAGLVEQEAAVLIAFAGACLAGGVPALAADSYQQAAKRTAVVPQRIEALRMAGLCFLLVGHDDAAVLAWKEAVDIGAEAAERGAGTFEEVGRSLAKLLEQRGLNDQAQQVRGLVARRVSRERRGAAQ